MSTPKPRTQFALQSRILHWVMAAMLLAMLFIGVTMVASLGDYHVLVAIHRPLGIMILILAAIRFVNRICTKLPPFPPTMSRQERFLASSSERLLYALMFALPLVGWGMSSAGHYPIVMFGPVHLPSILPANPTLYDPRTSAGHIPLVGALSPQTFSWREIQEGIDHKQIGWKDVVVFKFRQRRPALVFGRNFRSGKDALAFILGHRLPEQAVALAFAVSPRAVEEVASQIDR